MNDSNNNNNIVMMIIYNNNNIHTCKITTVWWCSHTVRLHPTSTDGLRWWGHLPFANTLMIFMCDMDVIKHVINIIHTYLSHAILMKLIPPVDIFVARICKNAIYRSRMSKRKATYGRSNRADPRVGREKHLLQRQ